MYAFSVGQTSKGETKEGVMERGDPKPPPGPQDIGKAICVAMSGPAAAAVGVVKDDAFATERA